MPAGAIIRNAKLLRRSETLRHIGILFSGKAAVQLIGLVSQPVLARLYTPAQFGEFAFFNSLLAILLIASSGRFEEAIVLSRRPYQAKRVFQLSQLFLGGYFVLTCLLIFLLPDSLQEWMMSQGLSPSTFYLIPFLILCSGYWQIVQNWLVRFRKYSQISSALLLQRVLIFLATVVLGFIPFKGNGLIAGLGVGAVAIMGASLFLHREKIAAPFRHLRHYAAHFRQFPLFSLPSLYFFLFNQHLPVLWLNYFYNTGITGLYSMATTLIMLPLGALRMSVGQIYYERLAQAKQQEVLPLIRQSFYSHLIILLPFSLFIFLSGESLTTFLLGDKWAETGLMAKLLAPAVLFQGLGSSLSVAFDTFRKQSVSLLLQVIQLVFCLSALLAGYFYSDLFLSLKLMSLFSLLHFFLLSFMLYSILKGKYPAKAIKELFKN